MAKNIILLGMGNPLLDISATVQPDMLAKYQLKPNDAILYDKEDIFEDLQANYPVDYIAGGATQNSIRIAQWILGGQASQNGVAFFGCVGRDQSAGILEKVTQKEGVCVRYQYKEDLPTGRCAVLITDNNRSLVTKLDAANHFTVDHLDIEDNWALVEKVKVFYSSGFFLTVCPDAMVRVGEHASKTGKHYALNLAAPFLSQFFKEAMARVLPYSSIVFGNETEAEVFAEENQFGTKDLKEIALKIAKLPLVGHASRIVVITHGCEDIILVDDKANVTTIPTVQLSEDKIVDTNGAGDAFVGGFLAQLALGEPLEQCIKCGIWAATEIIQRSGCTVPDKKYVKS